jgi:predicted Co/Zn/Cd cation transporter (cation efflux family)
LNCIPIRDSAFADRQCFDTSILRRSILRNLGAAEAECFGVTNALLGSPTIAIDGAATSIELAVTTYPLLVERAVAAGSVGTLPHAFVTRRLGVQLGFGNARARHEQGVER